MSLTWIKSLPSSSPHPCVSLTMSQIDYWPGSSLCLAPAPSLSFHHHEPDRLLTWIKSLSSSTPIPVSFPHHEPDRLLTWIKSLSSSSPHPCVSLTMSQIDYWHGSSLCLAPPPSLSFHHHEPDRLLTWIKSLSSSTPIPFFPSPWAR